MSLLIVGDPEDLISVYLTFQAEQRGMPVIHLSEAEFGISWSFSCDDYNPAADTIFVNKMLVSLKDVSGVYVRFNPVPEGKLLLQLEAELFDMYIAQRRAAMHLLLSRFSCPVVNPPTAGHSNGSKPFQMCLLDDFGLSSPRWIASNNPEKISAFNDSCPEGSIVKSCSGLRSEVREFDDVVLQRICNGSPPVLVQQKISGDDVRVHTVNGQSFATMIAASSSVDYRFAKEKGEYKVCDVPEKITDACYRFAAEENLLLAGFDFKVDSDGTWWCLECNPAPTFLPYEMATGQPISEAVLDLFNHDNSSIAG